MADTIADIFANYLKQFNVLDPIFREVVVDTSGTPAVTINDFTDFNVGMIAGLIEWNRRLTVDLAKQLDLSQATGKWLDLIVHEHIGIVRYGGESDADYVDRVQNFIAGPKISPGGIIYFFRRFSPGGEPEILEGERDGAFADASFSDNYVLFQATSGDWVFPALAASSDGRAFFFTLKLYNTDAADIPAVVDAIQRWVAAGIEYDIQIEYI